MAITLATAKRRARGVDPDALTQVGFTCAPVTSDKFVCSRVLWEDDRFGRVVEVVALPGTRRNVRIEVSDGSTPAGETRWRPLETLSGGTSDAASRLSGLIRELSADLFARTAPADAPVFDDDDDTPYRGLV